MKIKALYKSTKTLKIGFVLGDPIKYQKFYWFLLNAMLHVPGWLLVRIGAMITPPSFADSEGPAAAGVTPEEEGVTPEEDGLGDAALNISVFKK